MALMKLIYALIALDAFILVAFFYILRALKKTPLPNDYINALREISEERQQLEELRQSVSNDLSQINEKTKHVLSQVKTIATEAELEVKEGQTVIRDEMTKLLEEMSEKMKAPIEIFAKKKRAIEYLLEQIREEKKLFNKTVSRAERIASLMAGNSTYDEVLERIQTQKYKDARELVAKGHSYDQISNELGMPVEEVKLITRAHYE